MTINDEHEQEEQIKQLTLALRGLKFPADKSEIVNYVRANHLNQETLLRVIGLQASRYHDLNEILADFTGAEDRTDGDYEQASTPSF